MPMLSLGLALGAIARNTMFLAVVERDPYGEQDMATNASNETKTNQPVQAILNDQELARMVQESLEEERSGVQPTPFRDVQQEVRRRREKRMAV